MVSQQKIPKKQVVIATALLILVPIIWLTLVWEPSGDNCLKKKLEKLQNQNLENNKKLTEYNNQIGQVIAGYGLGPEQTRTVQSYFTKIAENSHFSVEGLPDRPCVFLAGIHAIGFWLDRDFTGEISRLSQTDQKSDSNFILSKEGDSVILTIKSLGNQIKYPNILYQNSLRQEFIRCAIDKNRIIFGTLAQRIDFESDVSIPTFIFFETVIKMNIATLGFGGGIDNVFENV